MIEYRRLGMADLESFFANRLRALEDSPTAFLTSLEEERARGNAHFQETLAHNGSGKVIFGALAGGQVIATLGMFQETRPKNKHKAMVWGMHVDADQRGHGIGGKLMDLAIDFAKNQMKVRGIYLCVESTNTAARALYEAKGFKCWGTEPMAMSTAGGFLDQDHMFLPL